jgi:hypothetical protein
MLFYSGKDKLQRSLMTKAMIRDDLAEIKDNQIQMIDEIIKDMIMRDNILNASKMKKHSKYDKLNSKEKDKDSSFRPSNYPSKPSYFGSNFGEKIKKNKAKKI